LYTGKVVQPLAAQHLLFEWCPHSLFALYLLSALARNARLPGTKEFLSMKLRYRLEPQNYEQRLQEIRKERNAETKQVERLSAILVKKATYVTAKRLPG
jgi:hypothetical protein